LEQNLEARSEMKWRSVNKPTEIKSAALWETCKQAHYQTGRCRLGNVAEVERQTEGKKMRDKERERETERRLTGGNRVKTHFVDHAIRGLLLADLDPTVWGESVFLTVDPHSI